MRNFKLVNSILLFLLIPWITQIYLKKKSEVYGWEIMLVSIEWESILFFILKQIYPQNESKVALVFLKKKVGKHFSEIHY